jgi:hypothetical protein
VLQRLTIIVEGPLAVRMQRLAVAGARDIGTEVLTMPQLAARLAGGFLALPGSETLYPAIRQALAQGGFADLEPVRSLPGMTRAVARSLDLIWRADLDLISLAGRSARLADLSLIEARVKEALPAGSLLPRDLRTAAAMRVDLAKVLFGAVTVEGVIDVDPLWRPSSWRFRAKSRCIGLLPPAATAHGSLVPSPSGRFSRLLKSMHMPARIRAPRWLKPFAGRENS